MTYCSNCGCKIEENVLFCPDCGTKVNQTRNENLNSERVKQTFENVKSLTNQIDFAEIINTFKTSALNPVSGGKQFVNESGKNHVIIIAIILTFLQGILGTWRISQIFATLQTIVSNLLQNFSSLGSLFGRNSPFDFTSGDLKYFNQSINEFKSLITIPYPKIFFGNCAMYLICVFVIFIFIYLGMNILAKIKCTPFTLFKVVLISTLPILTCEIISIIFSYFSLTLGIGFIILGALISITTLVIISKEILQIKENLCVLIVSISFLFALAAFFIGLQNFISSDLSDIVRTAINS
ncbi:MAG: zinc ribbon domain-containing protein [Clostridium sp.]|uniref:zinc ribbon domain-containing protein n=1 Tax=Clostridium sp. TaxID=1506 RepID=UPI003D6D3338